MAASIVVWHTLRAAVQEHAAILHKVLGDVQDLLELLRHDDGRIVIEEALRVGRLWQMCRRKAYGEVAGSAVR